ncbi:hypothetical protein GOODEAATRI_033460, partial [Goodea atripinnis]
DCFQTTDWGMLCTSSGGSGGVRRTRGRSWSSNPAPLSCSPHFTHIQPNSHSTLPLTIFTYSQPLHTYASSTPHSECTQRPPPWTHCSLPTGPTSE